MKRILLYIALIIFISSCKKKQDEVKVSGSFTLEGTSYVIESLRVDHEGYASDSSAFILHANFSGQQGNVHLYLVAPDNDFLPGFTYDNIYADSASSIIIRSSEGEELRNVRILSAELSVDVIDDKTASGKNWLSYSFSAVVDDGSSSASLSGQYIGPHTVNYSIDQPSYGYISFDTIESGLARPTLYHWDHLFCDNSNYFELKFYSNSTRFSDKGTINSGIQFVLGIHSDQQDFPAVGEYLVSMEAEQSTLYYGHREGSVNWGTYWQTFYSGSIVGKANILSDTLHIYKCTPDSITLDFSLGDQLGNTVAGYYSGLYY